MRAIYEIPPLGTFGTIGDPLQEPIEIQPDWMLSEETFENDAGNPSFLVLNSADFPFASTPTREVADLGFVIARNEPVYPIAKAISLSMTVNQEAFTIPGVGSIDAGQGLLRPIAAERFKIGGSYVRVLYPIWIRQDGWRLRVKDQGFMGWARDADSKLVHGPFCNSKGIVSDEPVLLNGKGIPTVAEKRFVLIQALPADPTDEQLNDCVRPAIGGSVIFPPDYLETTSAATFIKFKRRTIADWTNLF